MKREEVKKKVLEIIVDKMGLNEEHVSPESKLIEDLGLDSLDRIELQMYCEKVFGIAIYDEMMEKWQTVDGIIDTVVELKN